MPEPNWGYVHVFENYIKGLQRTFDNINMGTFEPGRQSEVERAVYPMVAAAGPECRCVRREAWKISTIS
jgi:hypothetical protein